MACVPCKYAIEAGGVSIEGGCDWSSSNWDFEAIEDSKFEGASQLLISIILEAQTAHNRLAVTHENRLAPD